jgi:hypothetical protein
MLDESRTRIGRILILDPIRASPGVSNIARFVASLIILGKIPTAGGSFIFGVLHPFLNTFGAAQECCAKIAFENLIMQSKITCRSQ